MDSTTGDGDTGSPADSSPSQDSTPGDSASSGDGPGADADAGTPDRDASDAEPPLTYPSGPYGADVGDVIENFQLSGFPAPKTTTATAVPMELLDFYNPTGSRTYPAGSPYGAGPAPLALVVGVGAVWCGPCNEEAKNDFPWRWTAMQPSGQILSVLDDGPTPGTPASVNNLTSWVKLYKIGYPAAIDPGRTLQELLGDAGSYPTDLLVRTSDMRILAISYGIPDAPFWEAVEALLPVDAGLAGDASPD